MRKKRVKALKQLAKAIKAQHPQASSKHILKDLKKAYKDFTKENYG